MTEAEKAVSWLKSPVEIGSSLIALDVETKEPHYLQWAGTSAKPSTAGLPFTKAVRVNSSTETRLDAPAEARVPVKVSPDITYKWSVWVYSNKNKTEIGFLTTSDSIGSCVEETTYKSDGRTSTSEEGIFVKDIPTGWSKHEGTVKFLPGTDNVHLYAVEWNKTDAASTQQWFAALDIVPDVPTQASVDEAQNEAIRANQEILRQQQEINALNTAFQEEQKVINATKNELDTLQNEAIKANSKVGETNTTAIEALKAALDSIEQIVGLDNAYKAQQAQINDQLTERQDILEEIQALQNQMISRTIVYDGKNDIYDDYLSVNGYYVVAKGTWIGAMVITTEKRSSSSDPWRTNFTQYKVPHLGSRTIRYYSGLSSNMDSARIDYWVYPGKSVKSAIEGAAGYLSGTSFTEGTWGLIKSFTMPENEGGSILNWESKLLNADRDVTYQVRLLVDGVQKKSYKVSGKGPMFPWEDGTDYVRFVWDLSIPTGATVRIEGAVTGSKANSTRAKTSYNRGTLTYTQIPEGS